MITNEKDRKICEKYSTRDKDGYIHCSECPLVKGNPQKYDFRCKANSTYNNKTKEWELDY
jgi:hypothetical protein